MLTWLKQWFLWLDSDRFAVATVPNMENLARQAYLLPSDFLGVGIGNEDSGMLKEKEETDRSSVALKRNVYQSH